MHILVCNDDGIDADGIAALEKAALEFGARVSVVAPVQQHSAQSHAITIRHPIMVNEIESARNVGRFAIEGTPTDCVRLAILELCEPIDLVISGINHGANMGWEIFFSGTVAVAAEAYSFGIPSVAFSQSSWSNYPMESAGKAAEDVLRKVINGGLGEPFLYNVNIPAIPYEEIKGTRVTTLEPNVKGDAYLCREAPDGRRYYWATWGDRDSRRGELDDPNLDVVAIRDGYVSITALQYEVGVDPDRTGLKEHFED